MHIVDGALAPELVTAGAVLGAVGTAVGLKTLTVEALPRTALLGAACFVATLIHVPVGPTSVHLILGGLAGLVLGWAMFPAMLVALLLDALVAGFGGVTVIGTNLFNTAAPGVLVGLLLRERVAVAATPLRAAVWGALAGGLTLMATAVLVATELVVSGEHFLIAAQATVIAHLPVMLIEAAVTAAAAAFLRQVKPGIFGPAALAAGRPASGA